MRSYAKAPSAGSTEHWAAGLGAIVRGALATRGASSYADGSGAGAPSGVRACFAALAISALALLALAPGATAATIPGGEPLAILGTEAGACPLSTVASGSGDVSGARGKIQRTLLAQGSGKRTSGSPTITDLSTSSGTFEVGEAISGSGIPAGTTIEAIAGEELTMSAEATSGAGTNTTLRSGSKVLTLVETRSGTFEVGQEVVDSGIAAGTTITAVGPETLTLSIGVTSAGTDSNLVAGSLEIVNFSAGCGSFEVGQRLAANGLQLNTTITEVGVGTLTLNKMPEAGGVGETISVISPFPSFSQPQILAVDEALHRLYAISSGELYAFNSPGLTGAIAGFPFPPGNSGELAVDNTELASAGRIYLFGSGKVRAFEPDGTELNIGNGFPNFPLEVAKASGSGNASACGVAVDPEGNFWVGDQTYYTGSVDARKVYKYDSNGARLDDLSLPREQPSCGLQFDTNGDLYTSAASNQGFDSGSVWKYSAASGYNVGAGVPVGGKAVGAKTSLGAALDRGRKLLYVPTSNGSGGADLVEVRTTDGTLAGEFASEIGNANIRSATVDEAGERVYLAVENSKSIYAYGFVATPDAVTGAAFAADTTHATLNGKVNPLEIEVEDCHFEYSLASDFAIFGWGHAVEAPCSESPGSGNKEVDVSADLSGLVPATAYRVRLIAGNENGRTVGETRTFITRGPVVSGEKASEVTSSSATLEAKVNPNGEGTSYRFQYVGKAEFEESGWAKAAEVPAGVAGVGSGNSDVAVSQSVSGLATGAAYRFRAVATNASATIGGPGSALTTLLHDGTNCTNDALRSGTSAHLPDCRAYEQVSPVDKDGFDIESNYTYFSNAAGDGVAFTSLGAFSGTGAAALPTAYAAKRTNTWNTVGINPPIDPVLELFSGQVFGISGDFNKQLVGTNAILTLDTPEPASPALNLYIHDSDDDSFQFVAAVPRVTPPGLSFIAAWRSVRFGGASQDGSVFYFKTPGEAGWQGYSLESTPPPPASAKNNLYEFDTGSGELKLVGILPDDTTADPNGASAATKPGGPEHDASAHAVSLSGAIFWQSGDGSVYRREGGHSTLVSAGKTWETTWMGASPTGAAAFYEVGGTVYRYDVATETSTDLGFSAANVSNNAGVLGFSNDGAYAYFASHEALTPGAFPANGDDVNLYAWHEGEVQLVARVPKADDFLEDTGGAARGFVDGEWRVSANGLYFGFLTGSELHGRRGADFVRQPGDPVRDNHPYRRAFLYDYGADSLACASCLPEGAVAGDNSEFIPRRVVLSGLRTLIAYLENWNHAVSDSGQFFFNTTDTLVESDTNEKKDVYQYEAGKISLISSGQNNQDSFFVDASTSGDDVFFLTREGLVGQDKDPNVDVYDARVNGGLAAQSADAQGAGCQDAEQCHDAATEEPAAAGPGSSVFEAPAQGKVQRPRNCSPFSSRARKLSKQARALRRKAGKTSNHAAAKKLRRRATRSAKRARKAAGNATRCRRANRRANR